MPLSAPLNLKDYKDFLIGTDKDGLPGAQLGPGQTLSLVSADPTIFTFAPDPTPQPDNEGVPSVGSFGLNFVAVGGPVNATATVTNADGTIAETQTDTVTVTPAVAGVAIAVGQVFERPLSAGILTAARKK